ncbi:MAG: hypothetical protein Q7S61_02545 [bacterium]|nr:hypothetical protein [bacterium]
MIYYNTDRLVDDIEIGVKDYVKYIFREGTTKAKRDLIELLPQHELTDNLNYYYTQRAHLSLNMQTPNDILKQFNLMTDF